MSKVSTRPRATALPLHKTLVSGGTMEQHEMNRGERLRLLTQTASDTLMGQLLRRFWHPIAISAQLAPGSARALRILSEDLTLYRGESGTPYLVGGRCAHRCTILHTGWVQDEQIRCMYHGWRYDGAAAAPRCRPSRIPSPNSCASPVSDARISRRLTLCIHGRRTGAGIRLAAQRCVGRTRCRDVNAHGDLGLQLAAADREFPRFNASKLCASMA